MKQRDVIYLVESLRERGRWQVEAVCWTRADAHRQRRRYANEQTPQVCVSRFVRSVR